MEKIIGENWEKIADKGQKVKFQNQGAFDILVRVEQENTTPSDPDGWRFEASSAVSEIQNGAVWVKSESGIKTKVVYEIKS